MHKESGTRVVERTIDILECFDQQHYELGVTEIAKMVDLSKATAFRIIKTLESRGYLVQEPSSQKYRVGARFLRLSKMFLFGIDIRRVALPHMHNLWELLDESVNLFISNGEKRICIERIDSTHPLRRIQKGDELPLDKGAAGKVLLAYGAGACPSVDQAKLQAVRESGYAVSYGERAGDAASIAAPIFDHTGQIVATLAITGPISRYDETSVAKHIPLVVSSASAISKDLGYFSRNEGL